MGPYERRASEEKMSGVWEGTADPPLLRSLAPSFVFARRWFRSLPLIGQPGTGYIVTFTTFTSNYTDKDYGNKIYGISPSGSH